VVNASKKSPDFHIRWVQLWRDCPLKLGLIWKRLLDTVTLLHFSNSFPILKLLLADDHPFDDVQVATSSFVIDVRW
jgi:hypothetical protein